MSEAAGCNYREHKGQPPCNKICDPGESQCPHHLLLQAVTKPKPPARETEGRVYQTPRAYRE